MINKKIAILLLFTFLIIGAVYAVDFKAPNGLEKLGQHGFVDKKGHNIDFQNYTDSSHKTWFENDTDYMVQKHNDTFYIYADGSDVDPDKVEAVGILEVVEVDGEKYIVNSWTPNNNNEKDMQIIWNNILEFNKLNKLTPIKI